MVTADNKPIEYNKSLRPRQAVWNYMRRNRSFRVGDILLICEISKEYLQNFISSLKRAGYLRHENKSKPYSNRRYTLLKNTGKIAPASTKYGLFDYNTNEKFEFRETKEEIKIHAPELLKKILKVIDSREMTREEIATKAGTVVNGGLSKWWNRLKNIGVVGDKIKYEGEPKLFSNRSYYTPKFKRRDGKVLFKTDPKRAKEVLKELEDGAYNKHNKELQQLCVTS